MRSPEPKRSLPSALSVWHPASLVATWFGSGLLPVAPGTWGSLAALPFAWLVQRSLGWPGLVVASGAIFALGWWAAQTVVDRAGIRDPGFIVVDEVAGQLLALAFAPLSPLGYALAFVLFRIADIAKPFPAGWLDAHVHGGLGVMADDMVAGLYAGLATWGVLEMLRHVL